MHKYSAFSRILPPLPPTRFCFSGLLPQRRLLRHWNPDPEWQLVDMDASDLRVGAVLDQKLYLCAFCSRRLTSTDRNYNVENLELPAVKMSWEQWQCWLEGAKRPFLVCTNHKNFYIQIAKWLTHFHFTFSYHPGCCNVKNDAHSWKFLKGEDPVD